MIQAAKAFAARSKRFLVRKLYKFRKFHGLHLARSSLSTALKRTWHKSKFWLQNNFANHFSKIVHRYNDIVLWSKDSMLTKILYRVRTEALLNYTNAMISFVNYRQESLSYPEKTLASLHSLVFGLEKLAAGKLSHTLIPAQNLHKFLHTS